MKALAEELGLELHLLYQPGDSQGATGNLWGLMTYNSHFSRREIVRARRLPLDDKPGHLWTDDFSNLFEVVA